MVKFFEQNARFPGSADDFAAEAVSYVADQLNVDPTLLAEYGWSSRTGTYHRKQIRDHFGFREFALADEDRLSEWLAREVCPVEQCADALHDALLARCRSEHLEPPARDFELPESA